MNVKEKFQLARAEGEPLYWEKLCIELEAEHAAAQSQRERENLLALFTILSDQVERSASHAHALDEFKDERRRIYHRLLLREACLGGTLCPKTLFAVTEREYFNGRMPHEDPLRLAALAELARVRPMTDPDAASSQAGQHARAPTVDGSRGPWYLWFLRLAAQLRPASAQTHRSLQETHA